MRPRIKALLFLAVMAAMHAPLLAGEASMRLIEIAPRMRIPFAIQPGPFRAMMRERMRLSVTDLDILRARDIVKPGTNSTVGLIGVIELRKGYFTLLIGHEGGSEFSLYLLNYDRWGNFLSAERVCRDDGGKRVTLETATVQPELVTVRNETRIAGDTKTVKVRKTVYEIRLNGYGKFERKTVSSADETAKPQTDGVRNAASK